MVKFSDHGLTQGLCVELGSDLKLLPIWQVDREKIIYRVEG